MRKLFILGLLGHLLTGGLVAASSFVAQPAHARGGNNGC